MALYNSELFKKLIEDNPITLIDVGARGGIANKWKPLKHMMRVVAFEPDDMEFQRLKEMAESHQVYMPLALGRRKGKIKLNITRNPACSSTLEPDYAFVNRFLSSEDFELSDPAEVTSNTLDALMGTMDFTDVDFMKLDTQGSELEILKAGERAISEWGFFGIQVEVELSQIYKDQPLFAEVDIFLRGMGYALFDITYPLGRKVRKTVPSDKGKNMRGQALWTDALYFKDFVSLESGFPEGLCRERAVKSLVIAEIHGFADFALELLDWYLSNDIFSELEYAAIRNHLLSSIGGKFQPELKLYYNLKNATAEFLANRFPPIYKLIIDAIMRVRN